MQTIKQRFIDLISNTTLVAVALPSLFCLICLALNPDVILRACTESGDFAVIGIRTLSAAKGELLVGPYSRFGFSHPGPVTYYFYAIISYCFAWLGSPAGKIYLAQAIINSAILVWILYLIGILTKSTLNQLLAFTIFFIVIGSSPNDLLFCTWNPAVVILPCYLALIAAVALAAGETKALLPFLVGAVFATENHLACVPIIFVLGVFALVKYFLQVKKNSHIGFSRTQIILCCSWLFLTISPIIIDAVVNPDFGNLGKIIAVIFASGKKPAVLDAVRTVLGFFKLPFYGALKWNSLLFAPLVFIISYIFSPRPSKFLGNLRLFLIIVITTSVISGLGVKGRLHNYIFWQQYAFVAASYFMLILSIIESKYLNAQLRSKLLPYFSLIVFLITFSIVLIRIIPSDRTLHCLKHANRESVVTRLNLSKNILYDLTLIRKKGWQRMAAVLLQMERQGFSGCVAQKWGFMFGDNYTCDFRMTQEPWKSMQLVELK